MATDPNTHVHSQSESQYGAPLLFSVPSTSSIRGMNVSGTTTPGHMSISGERTPLLDEHDRDAEEGRVVYGAGPSKSKSGPPHPRTDLSKWNKRVRYYIPSLAWIPEYSFSLLGGDVLAGFTLACMLVPQSVSYASSLAKLSPLTGLFAASVPGIIYALLGTSRQLNVGPEAALSLLVGQAVTDTYHALDPKHEHPETEDPSVGLAVATIITIQAGLCSFLLGFFRLGFIDVVLSRALLRGFITAIAVVIMIQQLIPMFGLTSFSQTLTHQPHSTLEQFLFLLEYAIPDMHRPTACVSFGALGVLVLARVFKNACRGKKGRAWKVLLRLPEVAIVVVVSTVLSEKLKWDESGVEILGSVPIKLGSSFIEFPLRKSNLRFLRSTTSTAVLLSVMGFLDSIVAAKQNGTRYGHAISPNRELVALGSANLVGSFIPGTLPAYGSITRSRINGDVGARTQMASIVSSGFVLAATFFLLPWMVPLPKCVLASVICLVVFSLLAEMPHDIIYYWKMRAWTDLSLMALTFLLSVLWNIEIGVIVSIIVSLLLVVRRSSKTRMTILGRIPGTDRWKPINENPEAQEDVPGVLIVRIRENLDFANTAQLKERLRRLELYGVEQSHPSEDPRRQPASVLVFHMADVETCDASAVGIFYDLLETYQNRNVGLFITHLRTGPRAMFERAGIMKLLGEDVFYDNVAHAMARLQR